MLYILIVFAVLLTAYGCLMIMRDKLRSEFFALAPVYAGLVLIPTLGLLGNMHGYCWLSYVFGGLSLLLCALLTRGVGVAFFALVVYLIFPQHFNFQFVAGACCIVCYLLLILLGMVMRHVFQHN